MTAGATAYDEIAYSSQPFRQTHPDRLATLGTIFGMSPVPPHRCRYLELGCGDGFNLIPFAFTLPNSHFVGIDLSATAIARGQALIAELGLKNIELCTADVMDWQPPAAAFDYIAAHGLFSWVPPPVQRRVLEMCRAQLAANGIAYISYNTYPGGHIQSMLRDMLRFHVQGMPTAAQKIYQAKALMQFLVAGQTRESEYGSLLRRESEWILESANDAVLYHDELSEENHFFYFRDFAALAGTYDLQFLAEADFSEMQDRLYPPQVTAVLKQLESNIVLKEQYLDFLKCRRFRQTLLCHAAVTLQRAPEPELVRRFWLSSPAQPEAALNLDPGVMVAFTGPRGGSLQIDHPLAKAALSELGGCWPYRIRFDTLVEQACARLGNSADEDDIQILQQVLFAGYSAGLTELHWLEPAWVDKPGAKPCVSALVRTQLGQHRTTVTSLRHTALAIEEPLDRALLQLIDGTRNRADLLARATQLAKSAGESAAGVVEPVALLDHVLNRAAQGALLTA